HHVHPVAALEQRVCDVGADEPRSPGDHRIHGGGAYRSGSGFGADLVGTPHLDRLLVGHHQVALERALAVAEVERPDAAVLDHAFGVLGQDLAALGRLQDHEAAAGVLLALPGGAAVGAAVLADVAAAARAGRDLLLRRSPRGPHQRRTVGPHDLGL